MLQLSVFEKGTPRCINFGVFLDTLMWWSMTINLWHLIIQISLVSVYQVSPIFNWRQPLRSITAMFPSHHLSNSLNHTTFPAQVAAVMLSCVPMHHGLAVCPVSNDHGTMMVGNRWWIGPICSQRIRVLYSLVLFDFVGNHLYVMYVHDGVHHGFFYSHKDCCFFLHVVDGWMGFNGFGLVQNL